MRAKWHRPVEWTFEREAPLLPTWKRNNFISSRERERETERGGIEIRRLVSWNKGKWEGVKSGT